LGYVNKQDMGSENPIHFSSMNEQSKIECVKWTYCTIRSMALSLKLNRLRPPHHVWTCWLLGGSPTTNNHLPREWKDKV
jgi:hypothetical protein